MRILKAVFDGLVQAKIRIGKHNYRRMRLLPNFLARTLKHEGFLDDIYVAVLKKREGAIIDVGVNTGQTLFKMLSINNNRPYFGFEPQITPASCIEYFLMSNKLTHYQILPIALSDKNGILPLKARGDGYQSLVSSAASVIEGFRPDDFYDYSKYIYGAKGDEVINGLDVRSISIIKIDVEGGELEVLRGLQGTIERCRPFIVFEVLHHYLAVTNENLNEETIVFREARIRELERIIRSKQYYIYQIYGSTEIRKKEKITPKVINDLASTDYIAVPAETERDFCAYLESTRSITAD